MAPSKDDLQAQLFPESDADPLNPLAENVPAPVEGKRARGRPPGSQNVATREMRDYLLANFSDPLVGRARVAMMRPQDLATALGCDLLEAFDRIEAAKEFVTKYVHQALPQAVQVEATGGMQLVIGVVGDAGAIAAPGEAAAFTIEGKLTEKNDEEKQ